LSPLCFEPTVQPCSSEGGSVLSAVLQRALVQLPGRISPRNACLHGPDIASPPLSRRWAMKRQSAPVMDLAGHRYEADKTVAAGKITDR
jgi:hypothetical protein